jgi:Holliday junction resolvasome RuvABC DNA-binding subunit
MEPISKKEIRTKVEESVSQAIEKLELPKTSKKTKRIVKKTSRKLATNLKKELKKFYKKDKKSGVAKKVKTEKPRATATDKKVKPAA